MARRTLRHLAATTLTLALAACGNSSPSGVDAAPPVDASTSTGGTDAATAVDAAVIDAGVIDAAPVDAAAAVDAAPDAAPVDAAPVDAAPVDAAADASSADASSADASSADASPPDAIPLVSLTIAIANGGGVASTPAGVSCQAPGTGTCSASFELGSSVTLSASPSPGYLFDSWSGDCAGTAASIQLTLDAAKSCAAHFLGATGEIAIVSPPPTSVIPNVTEDPSNVVVFLEQADVLLAADVPFDAWVPSTYTTDALSPGVAPAGLRINSYFLHFDPVGVANTTRVGSITFPHAIVGVAVTTPTLEASDGLLGHGSVTYPTAGTEFDRRLELTSQDGFTISSDRRTLTIDFVTTTSADQIRILTLAAGETMPLQVFGFIPGALPADLSPGASQTNAGVQLYLERDGFTLPGALTADTAAPGFYASVGSLASQLIAAGVVVDSYLLHVDTTMTSTFLASAQFDRPVLGVFVTNSGLTTSTAVLGVAGTTYPASDGVEFSSTDRIRIGTDGTSLSVRLLVTTGIDQVRVLLADTP